MRSSLVSLLRDGFIMPRHPIQPLIKPGKGIFRRRRTFTLVEMLVVIALIGILAALLMPALQGALDSARASDCRNRLRQFMIAMNSYAGNSNGIIAMATPLPPSGTYWAGWDYPLFGDMPGGGRYLDDKAINYCPFQKSRHDATIDSSFAHYGGNVAAGVSGSLNGALPGLAPCSYKRLFCRVGSLTNNHILVADTWQVKTGVSQQWYYFTTGAPWESNALHLRHNDRVNLSFIDGHAEAAGTDRLIRCGMKYAYTRYDVLLGPLF